MSDDTTYIRNAIRVAVEARRTIRDMKPAERIARDDLGTYLKSVIDRLKGLDIPTRLKEEAINREVEIGLCEDAIRAWLKERGQSYLIPRGPLLTDVTATLVTPSGERIELGKGVHIPPEGLDLGAPEGDTKVYGRGRVFLRVIDGGKKS